MGRGKGRHGANMSMNSPNRFLIKKKNPKAKDLMTAAPRVARGWQGVKCAGATR